MIYLQTFQINPLQKSVENSREGRASTWLTALPLSEHGYALHKGAFRNALCLRYGWHPPLLLSKCACVWQNLQCGTLSCPYGGFPTIRHNKVRDITAHLLSDVCQGVGIEPLLQSITTEQISHRTANIEDGARLDIKAQGFWNNRQCAYLDVRVFNPLTHTYHCLPLPTCYRRDMNRSLSPLVFSASEGMGPTAKVVYKKLASMIASKHNLISLTAKQ